MEEEDTAEEERRMAYGRDGVGEVVCGVCPLSSLFSLLYFLLFYFSTSLLLFFSLALLPYITASMTLLLSHLKNKKVHETKRNKTKSKVKNDDGNRTTAAGTSWL